MRDPLNLPKLVLAVASVDEDNSVFLEKAVKDAKGLLTNLGVSADIKILIQDRQYSGAQEGQLVPLSWLRNRALSEHPFAYVWFLDADVIVSSVTIGQVYLNLRKVPNGFSVVLVKSKDLPISKDFDELLPGNPSLITKAQLKKLNKIQKYLAIFKTRSIEIICNPNGQAGEFKFPENRGIGVDGRVGSENIFLAKCIKKSAYALDGVVEVGHRGQSSGRRLEYREFVDSGHVNEIFESLLGWRLIANLLTWLYLQAKWGRGN